MKNNIKLLVGYPSKFLRWIKEGRFHNFSFLIIVVTVLYFLEVITYQPKYISAAFLIFGLSIIIINMLADAKRFLLHKPNTPINWFKKFPPIKPKPVKINVGVASTIITTGRPHVRISISENASLEEKVAFLLKQKEEIETSIINLDDKLDNNISEFKKEIKVVEEKIEETKKVVLSTISDITIGDYDLGLFSVVLMICGTFLQILI
jgi:hypothetical protein